MDDIVKQALKKWPNVPNCHGWLGLDARGHWYLRDDATQAAGPFPQAKGSLLEHEKLLAFIGRNYEHDAEGCWFFQNGPQRVYVELEAAPWTWRLQPDGTLLSHTGRPARFASAWLDDGGRLFADTDLGFGLLHSLDVEAASGLVESGAWAVSELPWAEMPPRFGFVPSPQAAQTKKPGAG
ncbi:MAG: DUF2946 family protein [Aquincola tertiaricarbonis]|uniref:DUF2946 family protein n=1 Tax=Aquincola TaxID=391952 RepID=UPI000614F90E|nr:MULTISPECIES: DUF2946 family protein [Aquincola]MCR5866027.1 DUF2946 family protein [Aquincola sp. J276]